MSGVSFWFFFFFHVNLIGDAQGTRSGTILEMGEGTAKNRV